MFRRHESYKKRGGFLPFVIFRMVISLAIFAILGAGIYSAYKQFSGRDPLKLDPKALVATAFEFESINKALEKVIDPQKLKERVLGQTKSNPSDSQSDLQVNSTQESPNKKTPSFNFLIVSDSHNENNYLKKAIDQAREEIEIAFIVGLGDYTEVGTIQELKEAKDVFDQAGIRYFLTAGDHDLWDSRDKQKNPTSNFSQVFGPLYHSFSYNGVKFLIVYNSDNYLGLGGEQRDWLSKELDKTKKEGPSGLFVLMHEPLFHPSSDRVMGKIEQKLKEEAAYLVRVFKEFQVREVFSGDIHFFTKYNDPSEGLSMTTIGAVASQRNAQGPRYGVVTVFQDGSYEVEDIEIKL